MRNLFAKDSVKDFEKRFLEKDPTRVSDDCFLSYAIKFISKSFMKVLMKTKKKIKKGSLGSVGVQVFHQSLC